MLGCSGRCLSSSPQRWKPNLPFVSWIIAANPGQAEQVKSRPQAIGWFVGQVMRETGGKANPAAVNDILKKKLGI